VKAQLVITRRDPDKVTTVELPPSKAVNELLAKVTNFFEEQQGKQLDLIEQLAHDGEVAAIPEATRALVLLDNTFGELDAVTQQYEIALTKNPRDES